MQRFLLLLFFCALFSTTATAQVKQQKLDRLFTDLAASGDFNGSVLVAKGDDILYERYVGYADHENKRKITGNTIFELASMGKQFTAMGIMILAEQKELDFDDPVSSHLTDFPYPQITIRHLLNMASGIPDYLKFSDQLPSGKIPVNQDILDFYVSEKPPLEFTPFTKFSYANVNYVFLASIIEKVSGEDFEDFLKTRIFDPAGMTSTRSYTSRFTQGEELPNYAYPYVQVNGQPVKAEMNAATSYVISASGLEGDGSIVSTPYDLLKWTKGLKDHLFVTEATLKQAYEAPVFSTNEKGEYGFGIYLGKNKVWHWGGWPGVQTAYTRYLADDTVAIYLKNVESYNWKWIGKFERLVSK
ncbi:MAG: serine hydrolase domain-containing protein [Lewinella sp.]